MGTDLTQMCEIEFCKLWHFNHKSCCFNRVLI